MDEPDVFVTVGVFKFETFCITWLSKDKAALFPPVLLNLKLINSTGAGVTGTLKL